MPYLIDTDWVIDHLANLPEATELLTRLALDGIAVSIITYMETFQGVERAQNPEEAEAKFSTFMESVPVVPFSVSVARRCARLRESLRKRGKRVNSRALDLLNAATAVEHELTLVTRNLDDYRDIPDLKIYGAS